MDIGLFDSGSGGLTVLKEILNIIPNHRFIYLADTANLPYGNKTKDEILSYGDLKMKWMKSMGVDIVSVACNTTDSVLYDQSYRYDDFFKYGIVHIIYPTVSSIVHNYKVKRVGIIATEATAKSKVFDNIFNKISNIETLSVSCPELVSWIESEDSDYQTGYNLIMQYIKPLIDFKIDSLIYGCTHYKFVSHIINDILHHHGMKIQLFDPAEFVAKEISKIPLNESQFSIEFYITDITASSKLASRVEKVLGFKPEIKLTTL
jgi:glutamate racemase